MNRDYFSIHNHTEFSNLKIIDSTNRADRMIDYAWELGLSGLCFTDHDCISGHLNFLNDYKAKLEKEWTKLHEGAEKPSYEEMSKELNFKVGLGNEIYLSEEGLNESLMDGKHPAHFYHMILIAKDYEGWTQIKRLSSEAWKRSWVRGILRTPTYPSDLFKYVQGGHLICTTACLGGYVAQQYLEGNFDKIENHIKILENLFGKENFFIELQPNKDGKDQINYNKYMLENYWRKYNFIFSTDSHYLKAEEREIHKAFLNSKTSKDREVDSFYKYAYMMSQQEVRELMPYVSDEQFLEMVNNTNKIRESIKFFEIEQPKVIAKVEYEHFNEYADDLAVFDDVDEETYPNFYYYLHTNVQADKYLAELVAHGYIEKYKNTWNTEIYYKRLEEEFWTIKTIGDNIKQTMSDYFISMSKMVDLMWEAGSLVGPARGSAGVMLINFLTGITQMNPVEMNLPFVWRFMHPSRPDYPDIDVDSESDKRAAVFNRVRDYFRSIGGDVINVCTFGTEGTKSAIKTAGRGLNIDDDEISYITSMIPNARGFDWSLKECYYGNDDDKAPVKAFVEEMNKFPQLWQLAQSIEGLVTRLGVHASGVICVNGDFINHGSYMKTAKGQLVTAFELHNQESCGVLKYDMLTVSALDRIHQALNYMLEDNVIQWQGSLRKTYTKYLAPEVLDYDNKEMWDLVSKNKISSLFQFDTTVGTQAIAQIEPSSLNELAISSSLMRLMSDGELPLEKYARFKKVPELWYNEMRQAGLNEDEMKVLEKYLARKCGVGESQEVIMQLVMDPKVSGFDMKEANKLRKTIAKKKFREIEIVKQLFYDKGLANGTRKELLDYVWNYQISLQLGYSFSEIHTTGYALIALQEMNLAYKYPIIYWNCACLSVDSSAINSADFYNLVDDDIIDTSEVDGKKTQNKMDYAKLASALDNFRKICDIRTPDINKSRLSFTPLVKENAILYGLKGISRVTEPVIQEIMLNRPFNSLQDFLNKVTKKIVTKDKVINLIKCGAFNEIEQKSTEEILKDFIWTTCEPKKRITLQNANMLIDLNLLPEKYEYVSDVYKITKELRKHRDSAKLWYIGDNLDIPYDKIESWRNIIKDAKIEGKDIIVDGEPHRVMESAAWDRFYDNQMDFLRTYITTHQAELLKSLNDTLFENEFNKYCSGTQDKWELDSLNFYFNNHPLTKVIPQISNIDIDSIEDVVEGAQDGMFYIKGKEIPKMKLYTIVGTVIDKDKVKGMVTIQTPTGVVNLKIYKDLFATFVNVIGTINEQTGEKDIEQDSFFEKGTHLLITGILRGITFVPKVYKNTGHKAIMKINLDKDGNFINLEEKKDG